MIANAPIERTVAWMNGGVSGSASFTETWLRPHESVSASMMSMPSVSSGRAIFLSFTLHPSSRPSAARDGNCFVSGMEGLPVPQDSIEDGEKLAGERDDGELSRLSGGG